ncbi:alpha-L-fucosidase [Aeoliella mucimassa]|nr:alpha-L-fucosidase [Aeoliella mucimassa]
MKRSGILVLFTLMSFSMGWSNSFAQQTATDPTPTLQVSENDFWANRGCSAGDARCQWFRDAKFGAIIHFGVYSELGGYYQGKGPYRPAEQIMGLGERRAVISPDEYLKNVASKFNPTGFDADEWVSQMKQAGMRYVIFTTKHHDGFCMFDTKTTTFDVVDSTPFGRDIVKELAEACRKQDMHLCLYYSIGDWSAKEVMDDQYANYGQYMKAQLKELLTNYGDVDLLWFDNWWYVEDQWSTDTPHARELYNFVRELQPNILVNDRCGIGVESDHGDYGTPENQLKGSLQERYFEVVMTCTADDSWGWMKGADNYRRPDTLVRNLVDSVSKGGDFTLNIGPNDQGEFPRPQQVLLQKIGHWTNANAQAIYGTVPAPEVDLPSGGTAYATKSSNGSQYYLHVQSWPQRSPLKVRLPESFGDNVQVTQLSTGASVEGIETGKVGGHLDVLIPRVEPEDDYFTVIKITK